MKSRKNGKNFQKLKISLSKQTNLIIKHGFSSAVRRAGPNSDSAGPNMDSARPFAKLDLKQILLDRSPSWTSPVRRTDELDQPEPVFTSSS
ncbi:hypothetical protein F2Q70_00021703 [Brassica cretica]|uniref:Uncharacterized protein n=2 Tax=Brassica cretica TaxID=69181 RepID=A0A3N6Q1Z6_BRACR|nr:hypothetical protein F2Q68_00021132 [Brassica cretica]KAF2545080.1 hypothetical protein F2Q70_00021703 [Brassica cretica]KAF3564227.1 hypothetical protein DY000_02013282 [Brassica cretica]